jgi:hypothetical protein
MWTTNGTQRLQLSQCYIAQSTVPGSNGNQLELIHVDNKEMATNTTVDHIPVVVSNSPVRNQTKVLITTAKVSGGSSRNGALPLKQLQQLMSATQIQCTIHDVRNALHDITSLVDLTTAIDLLATSPGLEDQLNVVGASFHEEVVKYCRDVLSTIVQPADGQLRNDSSIRKNPHVLLLSQKVAYHEQVRRTHFPYC